MKVLEGLRLRDWPNIKYILIPNHGQIKRTAVKTSNLSKEIILPPRSQFAAPSYHKEEDWVYSYQLSPFRTPAVSDTHIEFSTPSLNAISIHLHRISESFALDGAATAAVPLTLLPIPFLRDLVEAEVGQLLV